MATIEQALELFSTLAEQRKSYRDKCLDEEVSWVKLAQLRLPVNDLFDGGQARDFVDVLDRPRRPEPTWFEEARAKPIVPLVVQAVSSAKVDGDPVALVFTTDPGGELDLYRRFTVAEVGVAWRRSEPKIVSSYVRCGECSTKLSLADGEGPATLPGCGVCKQQGWRFGEAGHEHRKPVIETTRHLAEPSDALAKRLWEAL